MIYVLSVTLPFPCLYVLFFCMFHILHANQPLSILSRLSCVNIMPRYYGLYMSEYVKVTKHEMMTS